MRKYNKLVRDKIPEVIRKKGGGFKFHVASEKEYWKKLKEKLLEEVKEFLMTEDETELADIEEVRDAIYKYLKLKKSHIKKLQRKKAKERGGFKKRIILDES